MLAQPLRIIAPFHGLALVAVALLLTGCAGGKQFVRPDPDVLVLGKTTEAELQQRMGEPMRRGTALRNGESVTTISYGYAVAVPYVDDVKTRAMGLYFLKGVLVGYEFTSSFPEDKTRFDDTKLDNPKPGVDAFLKAFKGDYRLVHRNYQIAVVKR